MSSPLSPATATFPSIENANASVASTEASGTSVADPGGGGKPPSKWQGARFRDTPTNPPTVIRTTKKGRQNTMGVEIASADDLVRNLDLDYQEVEKRTLSRWVNAQLSQVGDRIERIETDLKDGKRLLKLLSVVSGQPTPKPERMNMRIHQLANVAQAFSFLAKDLGADAIPDIGNEAIVNGDLKKTLALVYFIMLKYQVQAILNDFGDNYMARLSALSEREQPLQETASLAIGSGSTSPTTDTGTSAVPTASTSTSTSTSTAIRHGQPGKRKPVSAGGNTDKGPTASEAKIALLYWVRIQLEDYIAARILPPIQDFSRAWRNGLAFCLLIHRHDPGLMSTLFTVHLQQDLSEKSTWHQLLTLAFEVADVSLHIPRYLDPEDLTDVEFPYEPSVMMYVSEYYKVMSRSQREESEVVKRSKAAKRRAAIAWVDADSQVIEPCISTEPASLALQDIDNVDDAADDTIISPPSLSPSPVPSLPSSPPPQSQPLSPQSPLATAKPLPSISKPGKTPYEAPIPVPIPSARWRRSRPGHQRESSLAEQDKMRIKADLNQRLQRRLTGHLPRGIHPTLDQLITIHDTLLAFIQTNTRTMDEIPDEFTTSATVGEYIDALEVIEEQLQEQSNLLDIAKAACDQLTIAPEAADDTLIRLTDLQRSQIVRLYETLANAWADFVELLHSTKSDVVRLQQDMIATEEQITAFKAHAASVEEKITELLHQMDALAPVDAQGQTLHPLDGTNEDHAQYERDVGVASQQFDALESTVWKPLRAHHRALLPVARQAVTALDTDLQQKYEQLEQTLRQNRRKCALFKRGLAFAKEMEEVDTELTAVQVLMDNDEQKAINEDAIQTLEERVHGVRTRMHGVREAYYDLFGQDDDPQTQGFVTRLEAVESRYRTIRDWVDQVRGWFVEAERIRDWIELRIATVESRNVTDTQDPLTEHEQVVVEDALRCHREHSILQREVERFDADDMTRLRAHVKQLTVVERDRELSPADTLTIEITLETLNRLSCLMRLMRARTTKMDMLHCRVQWQQTMAEATTWIQATDQEVETFLHQARWTDASDATTPSVETMIQTLVDLERRIADFDQGLFSQVLDNYQSLEDMSMTPLPAVLEKRQVVLEQQLAALMQRASFARKVVEQHLAMVDLVTQLEHLQAQGQALTHVLSSADSSALPGESEAFIEQVQRFKESSAYLVTEVAATIPYPDDTSPVETDNETNRQANATIRAWIQSFGMALAVTAEGLEAQLTEHRQHLSLQQRASLAADNLTRIAAWFKDGCETLHSTQHLLEITPHTMPVREHASHLAKEYNGMTTRLEQMERGDYAQALERARHIELAMDEANTVTIDRQAFIASLELAEQCHLELNTLLHQRAQQLELVDSVLAYYEQCTRAEKELMGIAYATWDLVCLLRFDPYAERSDTPPESQETHSTLGDLNSRYKQVLHHTIPETDAISVTIQKLCDQLADEQQQQHVVVALIAKYKHNLDQKQHGVKRLLDYVSALHHQKDELAAMFGQAETLQDQGKEMINSLVKMQQRRSDGPSDNQNDNPNNSEWDSRVQAFHDAIQRLHTTAVDVPPPPEGIDNALQWDFGATGPVDYHQRVQAQIKNHVDYMRQTLVDLEQSFTAHVASYQMTDHWKQQADQCVADAQRIAQWIQEQRQLLQQPIVEPSQATPLSQTDQTWIASEQLKYNATTEAVNAIEKEQVIPLQMAVERLLQNSVDGQSHETITRPLSDILEDMALLKDMASQRLAELDAMTKRVAWETQYTAGMARLKSMTDSMKHTVSCKDGTSDTETSARHVATLEQSLNAVTAEKTSFQDNVAQVQTAYAEFVKALAASRSFDTAVPVHFEACMDAMHRGVQRLETSMEERRKQVAWAKRRLAWEKAVQGAFLTMAQLETSLQQFIQTEARWRPEKTKQDRHKQLEAWCTSFQAKIKSFEQTNHTVLEQELSALQQTAQEGTSARFSDSNLSSFRALSEKNIKIGRLLDFAVQVVAQYGHLQAFFSRTDILMATMEATQEAFLTAAPTNAHRATLDAMATEIKTTCFQLRDAIPYPVRPSDDSATASLYIEDEAIHAVMRDMVDARISQLQECVDILEDMLASKVMVTRCQMQLHLYQKHAVVCENWLKARNAVLVDQKSLLESATSEPMTMARLQEALGAVQGIQRVMQFKDHLFTALIQHFDAYVAAYNSAQGGSYAAQDEQFVHDFDNTTATHTRLMEGWNQLTKDTDTLACTWDILLPPTEHCHQASELVHALQQLQTTIHSVDVTTVTDDQILQWQKRVDTLETQTYRHLLHQLSTLNTAPASGSTLILLHSSQTHMDTAEDVILAIRTQLTALYDSVNANRLRKTFMDNATAAHHKILQLQDTMTKVNQRFAQIAGDTAEIRKQYREASVLVGKDVEEQVGDCREARDDLAAYMRVVENQGVDQDDIRTIQEQINAAWAEAEKQYNTLLSLLSSADQWADHYATLDRLQQELKELQTNDAPKPRWSRMSYSRRRQPTADATSDPPTPLRAIDKSLSSLSYDLQALLTSAQATAKCDLVDNFGPFEQHWRRLQNDLVVMEQSVGERKMALEKASLLDALTQTIKKHTALCEEQLAFVKQQAVANPTLAEKKATVIQNVIQTSSTALASVQLVLDQCKQAQETTIADGCERLVKAMSYPRASLDQLLQPLCKAMSDLEQKIRIEKDYLAALRLVCHHAERETEMHHMLVDFKATVSKFSRGARVAHIKGSSLPDLDEFERRYKATETSIHTYYNAAAKLKTKIPDSVGSARMASIRRSIDRRKESVQREWARIKVAAEGTRSQLEETQKQQHTHNILSDTLRIVNELKQRVSALQPMGKSVDEQELKEIQEYVSGALVKRVRDLDALLVSLSDKDGRLKRRRQDLAAVMEEVDRLIQVRQQQAIAEGSVAVLLSLFDQMDEHMAQVSDLMDRCAPHHARVVHQRFNKGDLQAMLRTLVTSYKEQEARMTELMDKAKAEMRRPLSSNSRVADRMQKTLDDWTALQVSAVARERELQACIKQLDHEFFTKLALAKTTTPQDGAQRYRKPPSGAHADRATPVPQGTRRSGARGSPMHAENRALGRRPRTPTTSVPRDQSSTYVADPKNELDVQLGRIVNESPFRIKVKMVPGQVGKYWFGEEQPRLVYCRILPSKLVMVRVGGGWVELERYLKDHSPNVGVSRADGSDKSPSPGSSLGRGSPDVWGRTTLSGTRILPKGGRQTPTAASLGGARSQSQSSSPRTQSPVPQSSGDVESEYIHVDEEGNQRTIKLLKAKQDARMPPKSMLRNP